MLLHQAGDPLVEYALKARVLGGGNIDGSFGPGNPDALLTDEKMEVVSLFGPADGVCGIKLFTLINFFPEVGICLKQTVDGSVGVDAGGMGFLTEIGSYLRIGLVQQLFLEVHGGEAGIGDLALGGWAVDVAHPDAEYPADDRVQPSL